MSLSAAVLRVKEALPDESRLTLPVRPELPVKSSEETEPLMS